MKHPQGKTAECPECGASMLYNGVMLYGNVFDKTPAVPVIRWDCPHCEVILADTDLDPAWGWQTWEAQGNKPIDGDA